MGKVLAIIGIVLISAGIANAEQQHNNLFKCVNLAGYSVDGQCTEKLITNSPQYQKMQQKLQMQLESANPNVLASSLFYPQTMQIKIIAQPLEDKDELAAVSYK